MRRQRAAARCRRGGLFGILPAQAAQKGSGDINVASDVSCASPKLQDRTIGAGDVLQSGNPLRHRALILPHR